MSQKAVLIAARKPTDDFGTDDAEMELFGGTIGRPLDGATDGPKIRTGTTAGGLFGGVTGAGPVKLDPLDGFTGLGPLGV